VRWSVVRELAQQVVFLALDAYCYHAFLFVISILSQVIQVDVGNDAIDPGREGAFELEAADIPVNF
jgi:hypothetical protein